MIQRVTNLGQWTFCSTVIDKNKHTADQLQCLDHSGW